MTEKQEIFLVDSNSFMTPYRFYYAFDLVPAYWKEISKHIKSGRIVVLDMIKREIEKGGDTLSTWMKELEGLTVIPHIDPNTIAKYQEVMQYVDTCGLYKPSALNIWAPSDIADPWLVASAAAHGCTIVTEEVSSGGLSVKTPNKSAKIPDVANHFGVRTANVFEMMRKLNVKIG